MQNREIGGTGDAGDKRVALRVDGDGVRTLRRTWRAPGSSEVRAEQKLRPIGGYPDYKPGLQARERALQRGYQREIGRRGAACNPGDSIAVHRDSTGAITPASSGVRAVDYRPGGVYFNRERVLDAAERTLRGIDNRQIRGSCLSRREDRSVGPNHHRVDRVILRTTDRDCVEHRLPHRVKLDDESVLRPAV
jgi:hypothetical protein